jgi:Domain of unknown function (DUF4062)
MVPITIMISSTINDLLGERDAVKKAFSSTDFIELIGAGNLNNQSFSGSSMLETIKMARECDLYILILGSKYGMEVNGQTKSATEIEFEQALRADPTKVLVFMKESDEQIEAKQQKFISKVCDYYSGYWRSSFTYTHELGELVQKSFINWLKNRASLNSSTDYVDHFIRLAKENKPESSARVYYTVTEDKVEITYDYFEKKHIVIFQKQDLFTDFWGCLSKLQGQFATWTLSAMGAND